MWIKVVEGRQLGSKAEAKDLVGIGNYIGCKNCSQCIVKALSVSLNGGT